MKKILALTIVLLLFLMVGCGAKESADVSTGSILEGFIEKIADDLKGQGYSDDDFEEELLPGYIVIDFNDAEQAGFSSYPDMFDMDKIDGGFEIKGSSFMSADKILVFKVNDTNYLNTIKAALEEDLQAQKDLWESYNPSQFEKVENTIFEIEGNYLYYITYENAEALEQVILNKIK